MKNNNNISLFFLVFIFFTFCSYTQAQTKESRPMVGLTVIPSFWGPGIGFRGWTSPTFGYGAEIQPSWAFDDFIGRGRIMYAFSTVGNNRWYLLATAGYMSVSDSDNGISFEVSFPTFAVGLGVEWLLGFRKNIGISIEAGYQTGSADYTYTADYGYGSTSGTGTFDAPPLYFGASLAYYF